MTTTTNVPPVLESGDRLSREEFHRRYSARPDLKKAELVEGVVYVASPVTSRYHGRPHATLMFWLGSYVVKHPELYLADNTTLRLDARNEVQPDACLWREDLTGTHEDDEGYIKGVPPFVAEVTASSAAYDLHDKKEAYRRNGVREYVVWRVLDEAVDWFRLEQGEYVRVQPDAQGLIESAVFAGLRLDVPKLLAGNVAGVVAALQ